MKLRDFLAAFNPFGCACGDWHSIDCDCAASCDTRRMAETENTGSVRSTGGAVPSEAQADAQPPQDNIS
jgi:hypothetical protein